MTTTTTCPASLRFYVWGCLARTKLLLEKIEMKSESVPSFISHDYYSIKHYWNTFVPSAQVEELKIQLDQAEAHLSWIRTHRVHLLFKDSHL